MLIDANELAKGQKFLGVGPREVSPDGRLLAYSTDVTGHREYTLVVKEREGDQETSGEFEAHLLRLGGSWFIDFFPKNNNGEDEFHRVHFFRGHSIARVELGQDSMQMAFLSASWLRARIDEKSIDTPHEKADGSLLLTGTTEEVQELANLYANDETAFADPLSLERTRVEEDVP